MAETPLVEVLECTICLDIPVSPIYNCSNGHIICGICSEKVKKCGLCQSVNLQVSVLAERLSRQYDFKSRCPNYNNGCHNLIASAEMKEHVQDCYYRNALCNEWKKEACHDASIPLKGFLQHLTEIHGFGQSPWPLSVERSVTTENNELPVSVSWPTKTTVKDNQSFILRGYLSQDVVYFWVTVLADKEEAAKHVHKMTLTKVDGDKKMECSWTMPVLPHHDFPVFKGPLPQYINIPLTIFYEFCEKEMDNDELVFTFRASHCIL